LRRRIRDRDRRIYEFDGDVLATASSERPGAARWSELVVYRDVDGHLYLHKIGHTAVAHDPSCWRVRPDMPTWLEAGEEGRVRRVACPECRPEVGDVMDPHTRLETQRYRVIRAQSIDGLVNIVKSQQVGSPELVNRIIEQLPSR
jgi:hypothetical protein